MFNIISRIRKKSYPLNKIELSSKNLASNYSYLSSLDQNLKIAPVLKSNAYGHGLKEIGKLADKLNPPFICVDSLYEAYILKKTGVKSQILIMEYIDPLSLKTKKLPFSYAVFDIEQVRAINKHQPQASIHLFVDTGMHREGIPMDKLAGFLAEIKQFPNLKIEGLMSHFAKTDNYNDLLLKLQISNFKKAHKILIETGIFPEWIHIGATGAIIDPKIRRELTLISNLARIGRGIYGMSISQDKNLKPVLKLKTKIFQIKKIKEGDFVGYDGTFQAKKEMVIANLPVGYFDGLDRRLSNKGVLTVKGVLCPIIGRISMNITTIDISLVPNPEIGMEAIIFSDNPLDPNSVQNFATMIETIPHEILVHLDRSTRREII